MNSYESAEASAKGPGNLADYAGRYDDIDWGNETLIAPWKGKLVVYSLPSDDPISAKPRLLNPTSTPDLFRAVRKDDLPGIPVLFERDAGGQVRRMREHNNASEKMR
jgi:hypothetical protein